MNTIFGFRLPPKQRYPTNPEMRDESFTFKVIYQLLAFQLHIINENVIFLAIASTPQPDLDIIHTIDRKACHLTLPPPVVVELVGTEALGLLEVAPPVGAVFYAPVVVPLHS